MQAIAFGFCQNPDFQVRFSTDFVLDRPEVYSLSYIPERFERVRKDFFKSKGDL